MRRLLLILGAVALVILNFNQLALTDLILARGDTFNYFYPYWSARDSAFLQGTLPLWSPDLFMGVPLLANPQLGTFYPPNWLTVGFTPPDAIRISILLHVTWALLGVYTLARRTLDLDWLSSLVAGVLFASGGYVGAHVEQINQLHGIAWMPWAFLFFHYAWHKRLRYVWLFGAVLALMVLSGHTQTVFITGVGLVIYAMIDVLADIRRFSFLSEDDWRVVLGKRFARGMWVFAAGGVLALILSLVQVIPTLELTGMSNRGGGFNVQQVLAFSWSPGMAARTFLPGYDAQVFGEYVAYVGVIGLSLALVGVFSKELGKRRVIWVIIALLSLSLAMGIYNPINWTLAGLPGFNLFRVPARWLALTALSLALLGGMGTHMLISQRRYAGELGSLGVISVLMVLLALSSLMGGSHQADIDGSAVPGLITWVAWAAAFVGFVNIVLIRQFASTRLISVAILTLVIAELWFASAIMPYNDLAPASAYDDPRLTIQQLQVMAQAEESPVTGRVLSISPLLFDPWDKDGITQRGANLTERGLRYALTTAKLKEVVSPNMPLVWGIPSVDGFDGGILPTGYYTQFSALLLPPDTPRTIDGRLRENLALAGCRGACLPDQRWLNLMNTAYLITDKVYDLSIDGVRYDTALPQILARGESAPYHPREPFMAGQVALIVTGEALGERSLPVVQVGEEAVALLGYDLQADGVTRVIYALDTPTVIDTLTVSAQNAVQVLAVTLIDARTGDFIYTYPRGWRNLLSSDVKLYHNTDALPRAFVVHRARAVADTWNGTEEALTLLQLPSFNPSQQAVIAGIEFGMVGAARDMISSAEVTYYSPTRVEIRVSAQDEGYLILTDAYYPGWNATRDGRSTPVYRANVMFRAVYVPAGDSWVVMEYAPAWLTPLILLGVAAWLGLLVALWQMFVVRRGDLLHKTNESLSAPLR